MSGYSRLRVEEGARHTETFTGVSAHRVVAVASNPALEQALKDVAYWKGEAKRAIEEREQIKASLEHVDGPAAFWRAQARDASKKLGDAIRRADRARDGEEAQRRLAIQFSEQVDALKASVAEMKRNFWQVWTEIDDSQPLKRKLWEVWASF